jgi:N-acetylneuraminic acid mutarotase
MLGGSGVDANGAAGLLNDLWKFDTTTLEWTWEAGSSLHDVSGTYGTLNTPSLQNVPGGRENGMAWTDTSGDLVLFGGFGLQTAVATHVGGNLNDLWLYQMNVLDPQASAPVLSPAAGTYTTAQSVTISDATSGAIIYYTTDGTTPTTSSTQYAAPITVDVSETIQAIAVARGYSSSSVASAAYTINLSAASAPTFSPSGGTYTSAQTVAMSDATPGATIYYTMDGSTPTTGATKYTGPVTVDSTETLLAIAASSGYSNSTIASAAYVIGTLPEAYSGKWVWMGGSKTVNQAGVYGTQGVPAAGNTPGSRDVAGSWTDKNGNLWLFGGFDSGTDDSLNDLWEFNPTTNQWAWMGGSNKVNQAGVYGTQGVAAAGNTPGARTNASSWTDKNGNLWLFGGGGYDSTGTFDSLNDLWEFNPTTNQWAWMGGSNKVNQVGVYGTQGVAVAGNKPGARSVGGSWTDKNGNLWLFGGIGYDSTGTDDYLNDLWEFNPSTNQWAWMGGSNVGNQPGVYGTLGVPAAGNKPGARVSAGSWVDSDGNFWLFGGFSYETGSMGRLNDLWKFNPSTNQWACMGGSNVGNQPGVYGTLGVPAAEDKPGGREGARSWTDKNGNLWLFGGDGYGSTGTWDYLNDLWEFNPTTNQWAWMGGSNKVNQAGVYGTQGVPAAGNTPGGRDGAGSWVDNNGNLWLFGGDGYDSTGSRGYTRNDLWEYQFDVNTPQAATPVFSIAAGTYTSAQTVTISDATAGATIYYTTDGSTPTTSSTPYASPIKVGSTETLKAVAIAKGYSLSDVASAAYTINLPTATPIFSLSAGTYASTQTVTISDVTAGATIYYTTDGFTPTTSSTVYSGPVKVNATETLKAVAIASGYSLSNVASAMYTINFPAATPTFSPAAGTYTSVQTVTVSDATAGATIYYTTDGSTPTTNSTVYSGPIKVSRTETLRAVAIASGYSLSDVASATYTLNLPVDFTTAASPDSTTIYTGEAAKYTIAITPINGFDLPVSLACSQLPANMTCAFSPNIVPAGSDSAVLIVQTSAPAKSAASLKYGPLGASALAGMLLLVIPRRQRRSHKLWMRMLVVIALCTFGHAISGCGAPQSLTGGTPVGKQSIVVTATAANGSQTLIRTSTVTVNVKSLF